MCAARGAPPRASACARHVLRQRGRAESPRRGRRRGRELADDEAQQAQRALVGPLQVVEREHRGGCERRPDEAPGERVEDHELARRAVDPVRERARRPREGLARRSVEPVGDEGARDLRPDPECRLGDALVRPRPRRPGPSRPGTPAHLGRQPRLADARHAGDPDGAAPPCGTPRRAAPLHGGDGRRATHERRIGRGRRRPAPKRAPGAASRAPPPRRRSGAPARGRSRAPAGRRRRWPSGARMIARHMAASVTVIPGHTVSRSSSLEDPPPRGRGGG